MPTIKKINVGGVSYDIGGLTEDVKQASLQIAEKVAYVDEHGQDYYDELYTAFYDNMWNVTNTLSNAVNSNSATKTPKDGTYTAIISAATGYTLDGATVSVTMGGANVTSAVYSNGVVNIPAVTGDVVITVVAVALTVVSISAVYTQSGTVYNTDTLDSLKADLVVTATFSDDSTEVVPSADYTLSGTLTKGTSTITVEYEETTTTFSVTVTSGFLYTPEKGILSAQPYITTSHTSTGELAVVETIENGLLKVVAPKDTNWWNKRFNFSPSVYESSAHIKYTLKIEQLGYIGTGNTTSTGYFAMLITDGQNAARIGFARYGNGTAAIRPRYKASSSASWSTKEISLNEFHTVEMFVSGGKQTIIIDNDTIVQGANLSTIGDESGATLDVASSNTTAMTVYFQSIEYSAD